MSRLVQEIMQALEGSRLAIALDKSLEYITLCKKEFMENLTLDSATNFAGSVILYSQICGEEKKPWKAVLHLLDAEGCLRFLRDFIQDREILAMTYFSFASAFEYACFYPEAISYYEKAVLETKNQDLLFKAASSVIELSLYREKNLSPQREKIVENALGRKALSALVSDAQSKSKSLLSFDPVENTAEFLLARYDVEREVDALLTDSSNDGEPFCMRYWRLKKAVLKDQHQIDWMSPAECNPDVCFQ